ncbi:hypothetical protein ACI2KR_31420 [Pseudomonas luteola]
MTKLTKAEAAWVKRLQEVLNECPSDRIGAYTIGDCNIELYDRSKDQEIAEAQGNKEFCVAVQNLDAGMGTLSFPFQVHSTSG